MNRLIFGVVTVFSLMSTAAHAAETGSVEYMSDLRDCFEWSQSWGQLGFDAASHGGDQKPAQLGIKEKRYAKGLGTSPGRITVYLDCQYAAFQAKVGVQTNAGKSASVVFQVLVDGVNRFDSGVMRSDDSPQAVNVSLKNAEELVLIVTDAGDGIACDQANWADARLVRDSSASAPGQRPHMDIARFAGVSTWDPNRMTGPKWSRGGEFPAADLFIESEVLPSTDGTYAMPVAQNGLGCIGLQWLARRAIRRLEIEFADGHEMPSPVGVKTQYWQEDRSASATAAGSLWQGHWEDLKATVERNGGRWVFTPDWGKVLIKHGGVWKVRWVFPASAKPIVVRRFSAFTNTRVRTADLVFQMEESAKGQSAEIELFNGEIDSPGQPTHYKWKLSEPLHLKVRYGVTTVRKYDRTVVRVKLPAGGFGVAVDDILAGGCVYVKDYGFFVASKDAGVSLTEYKRKIAGLKTIRQQVSQMPDQTLRQAVDKIFYRPTQNNPFLLLSLAGDNHKLLVMRNGTVSFRIGEEPGESSVAIYPCEIRPVFGSGKTGSLTRTLHGGWLPAPITSIRDGGLLYRQRTFVAPYDRSGSGPGFPWLDRKPLGVMEITVENPEAAAADASVKLSFSTDASKKECPKLCMAGSCLIAQKDGRLFASVDASQCEKMGTGTSPDAEFSGFSSDGSEPVPIFSQPLTAKAADNGLLLITGTIPAKSSARCYVYIPMWDVKPDEYASLKGGESLVRDVETYWKRLMAPAMQIDIPDEALRNVILASQVYCMTSTRNEAAGARFVLWDGAVVYGPLADYSSHGILGLDMMGHHEFAKRCLDFYIKRYNPEGFIAANFNYTLMGAAWHMWTVARHFDLSGDRQWLDRNAAAFARVCRWMMAQRDKTKKLDAQGRKVSVYGLVPPGVTADWDAMAYYFCLNGYYYAGLANTGRVLGETGHPDAKMFRTDAAELRADILRAFYATRALTPVVPLRNGVWTPGYPSHVHCPAPIYDFHPGEDWGRAWCYDVELGAPQLIPLGVMEPNSRDAERIVDHLEDVQFLADRPPFAFYPASKSQQDPFNLGGFSRLQPYITRAPQTYALRDEAKPFIRAYFNCLASGLNTETLSSSEHPGGTGSEVSPQSMGHFLEHTRLMFVMERDDELWLAPFVTDNWLKDGMTVTIRNAPTRFGKASYSIASSAAGGHIDAVINPPSRATPKRLVIRVRHPDGKPIRSVTVDGQPHRDFDPQQECVYLAPTREHLKVRLEY